MEHTSTSTVSEQVIDACPLCGQQAAQTIEKIPYKAIWEGLEDSFGACFTTAVKEQHTTGEHTMLVECDFCGLNYFTPLRAGDAGFYRELMRGASYEDDRWEFPIVASMLDPGVAIVDIGAGSGAFLLSLGELPTQRVAIDHNCDVARAMGKHGIAFHRTFDTLLVDYPEVFDVACAFQLLEHLPAVAEVMEPARACLRPGGTLFISVPTRERARAPGLEPLDCPPHHLSRWAPAQFDVLAQRFDLRLQEVRTEPPNLSNVSRLRECALQQTLSPLMGARSARWWSRVLRRATLWPTNHERKSRLSAYQRRGVYGHTMLAKFERPA